MKQTDITAKIAHMGFKKYDQVGRVTEASIERNGKKTARTSDYENFRLGQLISNIDIPDGATVYFLVKKISGGLAQYDLGFGSI
ncbi:hypothetical protein [Paenibacillus dendritiformis]|uniref:hypothetical protein n=1 Tax=Paenibacillus dendritiformis TaxID=130049 RepID=UPI000DA811ED|nr:hypothetical protein [Paenibacillus dendritiformis]PZM65898.1 hypothetical protein DOE73_09195 [Paenibacillus dendritiformis]